MLGIVPIEGVGIGENGGGFSKRDTVFLEVVEGLAGVPREHIYVYTLIGRDCKGAGEGGDEAGYVANCGGISLRVGPGLGKLGFVFLCGSKRVSCRTFGREGSQREEEVRN